MTRQLLGWVWLAAGLAAAYYALEATSERLTGEVLAFGILVIAFFVFKKMMFPKRLTQAPSGAIVMSTGVFVSDLFLEFPPKAEAIIEMSVLLILVLWLFLIWAYTKSIFTGDFFYYYLKGTLTPFAMGTWLAGSSVCSMGLLLYLKAWTSIALFIIFVNSCLWFFYIVLCTYKYFCLFKQGMNVGVVHGIILLTTVSTQSLVIDYSLIFPSEILKTVVLPLLCIGVFFYVVGLFLMIRSYVRRTWRIEMDWKNTNCIIHGALSITGLAATMSGWLTGTWLFVFWACVLAVLLIVEGIEIVRAYRRIKFFGVEQGIGVYHVSQWARNFTFSMFLAFTVHLPVNVVPLALLPMMNGLINILFATIIALLVCQTVLFFRERVCSGDKSKERLPLFR